MQRIIGIDPGSKITGYGIIDSDGRSSSHVASGCIVTKKDDLPQRLGEIYSGITAVIAEYQPEEMAVEQLFVSRNAATALKLGQARGAAICAGVAAALPVAEYTPRMVKQALVGSGAAEKAQVEHMVRLILKLQQKLAADEADALAVAISHAHSQTTLHNLARALEGKR
jgi:crossover junction endodeoxyribonuclease RuvC